jgi:cyclophilin family peptidyl-prolyl cis-trans isomerase
MFAATIGCGSHPEKTADSASAPAQAGSAPRAERSAANLETPTVKFETTGGNITVKLDGVHSPGTVRNFLNYVNDNFYDGTLIHYVSPDKMLVAGGYAADRSSKPGLMQIRNEADNNLKNTRGTIAMTRDPNLIDSATSQFFINLADAPQRDHTGDTPDKFGYCVFGEVTEGLEVADKISKSPTADHGGDLAQTPDPPVIIKSARVVPSS